MNRAIDRPASAKSGFQSAAVAAADAPESCDGSTCTGTARRLTRRPVRSSVSGQHPGPRVGRIQLRDDVGAANRHQPPRTLAVPEEERGRLRRGERTPPRAGSIVLVDVLQVIDIGRVADRFIGGRVRIAQVSQRGVGAFGERLRAALDVRQADQTDIVARQRGESQQAASTPAKQRAPIAGDSVPASPPPPPSRVTASRRRPAPPPADLLPAVQPRPR